LREPVQGGVCHGVWAVYGRDETVPGMMRPW